MSAVREIAKVRVSKPVDGKTPRRARGKNKQVRMPVLHIKVNPMVMEAALRIRKPGQKLKIVSETEVWLVNDVAS